MIQTKKAFTLVELIVVIVILAILGTISFISLQGYSSSARDVKRSNDVRGLEAKIVLENAKGVSYDELLSDKTGNIITINGISKEATIGIPNFEVLKENQSSFQDPSTKENYKVAYAVGTYSTIDANGNEKKERYSFYQLAYKEETTNMIKCIGNYYPIGIASGSLFDGTEWECGNKNHQISNIFDGEVGIEHLDILYNGGINYSGNPQLGNGQYNAMQEWKEIVLKNGDGTGYIIMDRNLGATEAYNGQTEATGSTISEPRRGYYYQQGNNYGFPTLGEISTGTAITFEEGTYGYNTSTGYYYSPIFRMYSYYINLWGDLGNTDIDRQGPCPTGRHVPRADEWDGLVAQRLLVKGIEGISCTNNCNLNTIEIQYDLKLPKPGAISALANVSYGNYAEKGTMGYYRGSRYVGQNYISPLKINNTRIQAKNPSIRHNDGFSVRCFKN